MPGRSYRLALLVSVSITALAAQFVRPDSARRAAALGSLDGVPAPTRRALDGIRQTNPSFAAMKLMIE